MHLGHGGDAFVTVKDQQNLLTRPCTVQSTLWVEIVVQFEYLRLVYTRNPEWLTPSSLLTWWSFRENSFLSWDSRHATIGVDKDIADLKKIGCFPSRGPWVTLLVGFDNTFVYSIKFDCLPHLRRKLTTWSREELSTWSMVFGTCHYSADTWSVAFEGEKA